MSLGFKESEFRCITEAGSRRRRGEKFLET
jgi:hypothetical protein